MPELSPSAEPEEVPKKKSKSEPFRLEADVDAASIHVTNSATNQHDATCHAANAGVEDAGVEDARAAAHLRAVEAVFTDGLMAFESVRSPTGTITDFVWSYVNPEAERVVGRDRYDLLGKRLLEQMPGNRETGLFDAYVAVVESGETWQGEFAYTYEG